MKLYQSTTLLFYIFLCSSLLSCNSANNNAASTEKKEAKKMEHTATNTPQKFGGIALYTLRDDMSKDPKKVLKEVADIGYKYVESAGYADGKFYGMTPVEFKNYLQEVGLVPISSHHSDVTLDNVDDIIAAVKEVGFKYFVIPIPPMGHFSFNPETQVLSMSDEVEEISNIINTIGEKCAAAGIECLYHNHDMEFKKNAKGIVPMDYFIEHSDPKHLNFQMDLFWVARAGADPIAYFQKAPGRFKSWHVKDMNEQGLFAPVGTGQIDFAKILAQKDLAGLQYYFVEQDMTFDQTPMDAIKISHKGLSRIGFE